MDIIKQVEEKLSLFKNLYDVLRIVDPINKKTFVINDNQELESGEACYCFLKRDNNCENCISMRAYLDDDTFVKLEYKEDKVFMFISTPVMLDGNRYIAEIAKDISKKGYIKDDSMKNIQKAGTLITEMNDKIIKDELTGIYNRRYINERLAVDANTSVVKGQPLSIIMADIDFFKNINEKYGHTTGDKVLADFAGLLKDSIHEGRDWAGRYGGEEFIVALNNTDEKEAYETAENIRKQLESKVYCCDGFNFSITSSFGVYTLHSEKLDVETIIQKADKNLYEAKRCGRNRTVISK